MSIKDKKTKRKTVVELFCQSTSSSLITGMLNHCTVNIGQKD